MTPPWPRCPCCGGPAAPEGPPALVARFEVETRSEANLRDRFRRSTRTQAAREATIDALAVSLKEGGRIPIGGPWCVRLTRIAPNTLDDDNLGGALKAVRDAVAAVIGVDDGSPAISWPRAQERAGKFFGVRIEIWGAP